MRRFQRLSPCGAPGLRAARRAVGWAAAWGQSAMRRRGSQTCVLLAAVALLAAACSGGDAPSATGTPSGEREQRTAAAVEQQAEAQAEPVAAQAQQEQVLEAEQAQAAPVAQAEEVVEAEFEDESEQTITFDEQAVERAVAALAAHRAGLEVTRNVLGDPAAPVLIVEYGDFQ